MNKFAINVVILPPDPVMDVALEWNRQLCERKPANIALGKFRYLPHISIVMGCIRNDQVDQTKAILKSLEAQHRALSLAVTGIRTMRTTSGNNVITLDITPTKELLALHEAIVNSLRSLLTQDADEAAINDSPPISRDAIDWINHYIPEQCFDNFWPHITIGFGDPPRDFQPFSFQGSRLAVCHLGNYCTCSTILAETTLKT